MTSLASIYQTAGNLIRQKKGTEVASLFNTWSRDNQKNIYSKFIQTQASTLASQFIPSPYDKILFHLGLCHSSHLANDFDGSFKAALKAAESMYSEVENEPDIVWAIPLINCILTHLRLESYEICSSNNLSLVSANGPIGQSQEMIKKFLQKMIIDRNPLPNSKKMACIALINHLFKIYFRMNNLRLCVYLMNMVSQLPPLTNYPLSHSVTYNYYQGRLAVFEENYSKADEALTFAFNNCHKNAIENKRLILQFLIPVKLLSQTFPSTRLINKYQLTEFNYLIQAVKQGNLKLFNESLDKNREFFIRKGIFLLLEKLKATVYRNLFRKVALLYGSQSIPVAEKFHSHMIPLTHLNAALRVNGSELSDDELECILANLIFQGHIKGYIAHRRSIVLSKTDPFPSSPVHLKS